MTTCSSIRTLMQCSAVVLACVYLTLAEPVPQPQPYPVPYPVAYPAPYPRPYASPYPQPQRPAVSDTALDGALQDRRYLQRQLKCALGEAPCDPVGRRLKTLAPLVLRGACPQCSPQETRQIQKVLSHIQRNYPREWSKLIREYAG